MNAKFCQSLHPRALIWVAPCIGAWSLIPLLAANTGGLDSHQYLFASSLVSAITLTICAVVAGRARTMRTYFSATEVPRLTLLALLGAFGYYALLYAAYAPCPGAECPDKPVVIIIAQYTWPAFGVAWSAILLRDRFTTRIFASLAVGLIAVCVGVSTGIAVGDAIAKLPIVVLAAVMFGLYSTLLKRYNYEPFSSLAWTFGAATVMSGVAMIALSAGARRPGWVAFQSVVVNGTLVNGLSYVCWQRALQAAPMTFVAPWISLTPLVAAVFTTPESPGAGRWMGIALVLLSVLLATLPARPASELRVWRRRSGPAVADV